MRKLLAIVALGAFALVLSACSGREEKAVFSFAAGDDLCEWIADAEVTEFVAAEFDWDGTATNAGPYDGEACRWELSSPDDESGSLWVSDGGQWEDFGGKPYDQDAVMKVEGVLDYQGGPVGIGEFVAGHPALSDGVVVHNGGFGQFAFAVPPDTEWLQLGLAVPGLERDLASLKEWEEYEVRFFAVVDHFLEELGWVATQ